MYLTDCYKKLEGDYNGCIGRLIRPDLVSKFLIMFLKDTQYNEFHSAVSSGNWEAAFRNIHTLKGTSLNLGLTKLADAASVITELLRSGSPAKDITEETEILDAEYSRTIKIIKAYSENPEI